jgi:hypothetical protein
MRTQGIKPRHLRRRMSVKGAIKKTRSINVDCEYCNRPSLARNQLFNLFNFQLKRSAWKIMLPIIVVRRAP